MRSVRTIHVVSAHAAGEVGDVIVGGVAPPPGETLWAQRRFLAEDGRLRNFVLNEPRGGVFRHVNLLVPPKHPAAAMGFLVMEPADTPPMSGSNAICVATVLLETGIVPMEEPETTFALEAPAGLVGVRARCRDGRCEAVTIENVPSFAVALDRPLRVEGLGEIRFDAAWGGDSFAIVDAAALGLALVPAQARRLAELGMRIVAAADREMRFCHPERPDWGHFSFCCFAAPVARDADGLATRQAVAVRPGKIDRSPTGTALSARMAVLVARGEMAAGDRLTARSIVDSVFAGEIAGTATVGDLPAIRPRITGRAYVTGTHQLMLDPDDPWPEGYRLSDTWPGA